VTEPDIEKKRKKGQRRRSARVYVNANKPLAVPLDEIAGYFPPDDDDDDDDGQAAAAKRRISQAERKRLAREGKAVVNPDGHVSYPIDTVEDLHNAAVLARTGHGDVEAARKLIARRARELNVPNPLESQKAVTPAGNPHVFPGGRNPADRTSASLTEGHQAVSSGHHVDPMNVPGPSEMAFRHADMRNGTTNAFPLATMRTDADAFPRDLRGMTNGVPVALSRLDAAAAAGMPGPSGNPAVRPMDHIARDSATPPNGGHGLADVVSHGGPAMKASDAREMMKRHLFPGSGGGR